MFCVIGPILHNSHKRSRFCTESCVLFAVRQGHTLDSVTANADTDAIALDLGHFLAPQSRVCQACFALSTAKLAEFRDRVLDFASRYWKCEENTRYCGLLLTCPTDSGIFSSTAVNGL